MEQEKREAERDVLVDGDETPVRGITRREFVQYTAGIIAGVYFGELDALYGASTHGEFSEYRIDTHVNTTAERMISFPMLPQPKDPNSGTGLYLTELRQISDYDKYGYGAYKFAGGLPCVPRFDIMPAGYKEAAAARTRVHRLLHFFTISDIHITDKEAPNQLIYLQQQDPANAGKQTSIYSPVMLYTTHVLDAAIPTINVLHQRQAFDFGISLGDTCNSTQNNELRWYIDVIDGGIICPSSGAHLGAKTVDYQKPYQAVGLDRSIPWYQVLGNHDHFWLGSIAVDGDPALGIRDAYVSDKVWAVGDLLRPRVTTATFPCLIDSSASVKEKSFYMGALNGATAHGDVIDAGPVGDFSQPPLVAADSNRRSLLRTEWMQEFFRTETKPVGHGLNLVDRGNPDWEEGFACYSFVPKADIPLKVIVLDDTQSETDGSHDIHGHGFLDAARWKWLQAELAAGQAADQLMIIAAHVPIAVANIGSEVEWWEAEKDPNATQANAVSLEDLVSALQGTPNLLMWIAGHRHLNTVKAFLPPATGGPESGFWQVETSSLRDFPQQFRTFEIYLNGDYSISMTVTNVDPAVAEGTPAATSRKYAIATQQIVQNDLTPNSCNTSVMRLPDGVVGVNSMDPTRPDGVPSAENQFKDPTIVYGAAPGVPYCASYNAELFKYIDPQSNMAARLKRMFPKLGDDSPLETRR
jgi:metallophosphoesterase (TIGR03768 family)